MSRDHPRAPTGGGSPRWRRASPRLDDRPIVRIGGVVPARGAAREQGRRQVAGSDGWSARRLTARRRSSADAGTAAMADRAGAARASGTSRCPPRPGGRPAPRHGSDRAGRPPGWLACRPPSRADSSCGEREPVRRGWRRRGPPARRDCAVRAAGARAGSRPAARRARRGAAVRRATGSAAVRTARALGGGPAGRRRPAVAPIARRPARATCRPGGRRAHDQGLRRARTGRPVAGRGEAGTDPASGGSCWRARAAPVDGERRAARCGRPTACDSAVPYRGAPGRRRGSASPHPPAHLAPTRQEHRADEDPDHLERDPRGDGRRDQGPRTPAIGRVRWAPLVIVESPAKAKKIARLPRQRLRRRGEHRPHPRPAAQRRRRPGRAQGRAVGAPRRRRRQRLRAALRGQPGPAAAGRQAQGAAQGRRRALPRDRRGPRGRGHRLAPGRRPSSRRSRCAGWSSTRSPRRPSPAPSPTRASSTPPWSTPRRPGASSTGSTATRSARCCGRRSCRSCPRAACSRSPPGSWSSASGRGWRFRAAGYWDARGHLRRPEARRGTDEGEPRRSRATPRRVDDEPRRHRPRLRRRDRPARPATSCTSTRRAPAGSRPGSRAAVQRHPGRREALPPPSVRAVHDLDAAAGGRPQAALVLGADDAGGAAAVRERPHHLHAHRLHEPVRDGAQRRARSRPASSTATPSCRPRRGAYKSKVKNAQEAHEAIRPAGDNFRTPGQLAAQLVRRRVPALRAHLAAHRRLPDGRRGRARPRAIRLAGRSSTDEPSSSPPAAAPSPSRASCGPTSRPRRGQRRERRRRQRKRRCRAPLTRSSDGLQLDTRELEPEGHTTTPPARYTEASLVKRGSRSSASAGPSTYASIIQTIQDRGYVWKKGSALVPTWIAFAVIGLLEQHFARLVDYDFTASLEDDLDAIAGGTGSGSTG